MDNTSELINHRYRIVRELGKGGFGATFLVEDTQLPSGKRFVLKELTPIEHDPQTYDLVKQRFEREAVILEELGGLTMQIPSLYAYFTEVGKFYLVQEYVEGETIASQVISQGVMSDAAVRDWLGGILPVLSLVHDRQIIHRDIKPENIILQHRDQKPVLIDFGAVRESMGLKLTPQGQSTQSIVIGTPGYMPSEQAAGRAMFSSDVYALGLTAIYALTGKIPQELPTDPMTGEIQWRQYAPTVSNGLAGILDRAIASHSRDRFTTAAQMMEALRSGFVSGMGVPGTVVSSAYPVNPAPVYPAADSQIRTVVAAHGNTAYPSQPTYPSQTGYGSPVPATQSSGQDPKTWLMAIGVGALVTLAGVGIYTMLRGKDDPAPVASSPATTVTSPVATPSPTISAAPAAIATPVAPEPIPTPAPVATPTPIPIVPASVAPAPPSPVAIKPTVNPAPSSDFNAEIMDPPSNCRSNPSSNAPVQKVLQRGDVLVDRTNVGTDSKGGIWYREQYLGCWIHQTQLQFKS